MAPHKTQAFLFLVPLLISMSFKSSQGVPIAIYWGQGDTQGEGTLQATCNAGNYKIVIIAFLNTFGNGQPLGLNLAGHCDASNGGCTGLSTDISACQAAGIKVLLSLGGQTGTYSLSSTAEANQLAQDLWNNFLGGQSSSRPLGNAVLDGIDFDIEQGGSQYWDDLARALNGYNNVILSAAPECYIPGPYLMPAIKTGLFTYVWPQFYDSPGAGGCQYDGSSADKLFRGWNQWITYPIKEVFLGLPASTTAANGGYIPPDVLTSQILPTLRQSAKFGGVMLWSKQLDNGYSDAIKNS